MPFDYQMVTFEEIIKNDFFKWTQQKIFALDLRLSEVVDDDFYLSWVVRLAIALVARYCELIHERFVALDPRLEVFSRSLWRAVGKVKERQLLLGVSSNFKFFHDDDF